MAQGLLVGMSQADLTTLRDACFAAMLAGENRVQVVASAGDVSSQKDWYLPPAQMLDEIRYALSLLGVNQKVKRTRIRYI